MIPRAVHTGVGLLNREPAGVVFDLFGVTVTNTVLTETLVKIVLAIVAVLGAAGGMPVQGAPVPEQMGRRVLFGLRPVGRRVRCGAARRFQRPPHA